MSTYLQFSTNSLVLPRHIHLKGNLIFQQHRRFSMNLFLNADFQKSCIMVEVKSFKTNFFNGFRNFQILPHYQPHHATLKEIMWAIQQDNLKDARNPSRKSKKQLGTTYKKIYLCIQQFSQQSHWIFNILLAIWSPQHLANRWHVWYCWL